MGTTHGRGPAFPTDFFLGGQLRAGRRSPLLPGRRLARSAGQTRGRLACDKRNQPPRRPPPWQSIGESPAMANRSWTIRFLWRSAARCRHASRMPRATRPRYARPRRRSGREDSVLAPSSPPPAARAGNPPYKDPASPSPSPPTPTLTPAIPESVWYWPRTWTQ